MRDSMISYYAIVALYERQVGEVSGGEAPGVITPSVARTLSCGHCRRDRSLAPLIQGIGPDPTPDGRGTLITLRPIFKRAMVACLVAAAAAAACGDSGPSGPSGPGAFRADLSSPNGVEGAAVFEITGGVGLGDVSVSGGEALYDHGSTATRVIVLLDDPGQIRFQIRSENVGLLPTVTVVQVADGDNELRETLSGDDVQLVQVEDGGAS